MVRVVVFDVEVVMCCECCIGCVDLLVGLMIDLGVRLFMNLVVVLVIILLIGVVGEMLLLESVFMSFFF